MWLDNNVISRLREEISQDDLAGGRYRLLDKLAAGGMGTVYLADDTRLERRVALKIATVADDALAARMRREARVVALLEHPGIVPIHDVGTLPDGRTFYAMKLVQGVRLDEFARTAPSLTERLRVFQRVCEAVAFAHSKGVIHRDLKPENVMVGSFGEVLVMDWGLAKVLGAPDAEERLNGETAADPDETQTLSGTVLGTRGYMAPEQADGAAHLDVRTDVYALGAMLYCLLMGRPPLERTSEPAGGEKRTPDFDSSIPRPVAEVVLRALAPDRDRRYGTVIELEEEIRRYLDGERVLAYNEGILELAGRWLNRNRFLVYMILAYLLMRAVVFFFVRR